MYTTSRADSAITKGSLCLVCTACIPQHKWSSCVACSFCHLFRMNKKRNKTKSKKENLVKSDGMKRLLSQLCTLRENQLPLACLGVEGEGSTQKQCNYSALAQQQRAKGASKAFLWAKQGSLRGKAQPVCEYQCMDVWSSRGTTRGKGWVWIKLECTSTLIMWWYSIHWFK